MQFWYSYLEVSVCPGWIVSSEVPEAIVYFHFGECVICAAVWCQGVLVEHNDVLSKI